MSKKVIILIIYLNLILIEHTNSLVCHSCNGCSSSDFDNSQTCTQPYSSCFVGMRGGLIYQGCTTSNYMQLSSSYTNLEVCSMNYCNKYSQNNRYSISCFYCLGCSFENANKNTQICPDYSYTCFSGTISGMIHQGCTKSTYSSLSSMYMNLKTCTNNLCNYYQPSNYRGLSCYSCAGCSINFQNNNIPETCPDTSYSCYVGTTLGLVHQGCTKETYSSLSSRFKNLQVCTTDLCNSNRMISMGLTCYSCQGCMSNSINLRTETCQDASYRCYSGNKLGLIYQGCTQWNDMTLYNSYSNSRACNSNYCNVYSMGINKSFQLKINLNLIILVYLFICLVLNHML